MQRSLIFDDRPSRGAVHARFALGAKGFRPFFLLAGAFAAAMLPIWLLVLFGVVRPGTYLAPAYWHAHEMVFGFAVAVIAGFLLTAVGNWTQGETVVEGPLFALSALWVLGRIAVTLAPLLPRGVAAVVDIAFLPALMVAIGRPLVRSGNRRNFVMLLVLLALCLANVAVHLDALGVTTGWARRGSLIGVDVVILLIVVIAGRVLPMFTRSATGVTSIRSLPVLDRLTIGATALLTALDAANPEGKTTALLAMVAGILAAARALHWGTRHAARQPLLWILHAGYAWVPLGLFLRGLAAFDDALPASLATHALTAGAIGSLTLGMMARVALGHTGRMLTASRPMTVAFAFVSLAALVRVAGPLLPAAYAASLVVAGTLWSVAFALYVIDFAPILVAPRIDGKPG